MIKTFALLLTLIAGPAAATTFTVINTNDSGVGSLRQAIIDAVAAPTAGQFNMVAFNIPGAGVHTIRPTSPLPPLKALTIDGYTQPGSRANTLAKGSDAILAIEIDGSLAGAGQDGLVTLGAVPGAGGGSIEVRGLVINRFGGSGIHITGPGGNGFPGYALIQGCYIGTDASGTQARGNGIGIELGTDGQATVGQMTPDFGGNTTPWPAYRNVISGNVGAGIKMDSGDPQSPAFGTVRDAYIGTDAQGLAALGNGGDGVALGAEAGLGSAGFGTSVYLYDNVIAANAGDGIDTQAIATQAVGNWIGLGLDGHALGNQGNGAYFHGASNGALAAAFGQQGVPGPGVANNAAAGLSIADTAIVDFAGPTSGNGGLGVDIAPAGPNANDAGDIDSGPNEGLNYPVIASAVVGPGPATRIQGTINTRPNSQVEVYLYMNTACNSSGYGEGGRFLGSVLGLTTDAAGNATFDKQLGFALDRVAFPILTAQTRRFVEAPVPLPSSLEVSEYSACFTATGSALLPTLSIDDVSLNEGNAGTTTATFTASLSAASTSAVTVNYTTADATSAAGTDYVAASGTLTFAAGQTTKTVTVTINGDTTVEPNETFVVNLSAASGATIADAQGQGTIVNDDVAPPPPTLSVNDASVNEGNAGTGTATFTVTLSAASASVVTVNYATADATAIAGTDYVAGTGMLTFAIGETTKTVAVTINGDAVVESNETFVVNLSAAVGATIADAQGQGTIVNEDVAAPPSGGGGGGGKGGGAIDAWLLALLGLCIIVRYREWAASSAASSPGHEHNDRWLMRRLGTRQV